ncbi:MAG TPA: NPCBM/NEW2 domain-containing protein, partial [Pirellulales bacterium]|nr:NPCBM/NEW2 domain-containing protein [Pirellulales bacterium]
RVNGEAFAKGLAVHARSTLTYALDAGFETFKATVGFDDSRSGLGRVACRVLGDGKVLYAEKDLRGDQKPVPLSLSVRGVRNLTLEVDFGEAENTGDRIIWGNARLLRRSAP